MYSTPWLVRNEIRKICVVPVSRDIGILPGGRIKEGFSTFIENEAILSPGVPVLLIGLI